MRSLCSVIFLLSDSLIRCTTKFVWIHSVIQALQSTQPNTYTHLVKRHKFGTSLVRKNIFVITHLIHKRKKKYMQSATHCMRYVCNHGAHSMLNGWRQKRKLLHVLFNECWVLYFKSMAYVMAGLCVLLVSAFRSCCCLCVRVFFFLFASGNSSCSMFFHSISVSIAFSHSRTRKSWKQWIKTNMLATLFSFWLHAQGVPMFDANIDSLCIHLLSFLVQWIYWKCNWANNAFTIAWNCHSIKHHFLYALLVTQF